MKLIQEQKSTYFKQVSSDSKLAELIAANPQIRNENGKAIKFRNMKD